MGDLGSNVACSGDDGSPAVPGWDAAARRVRQVHAFAGECRLRYRYWAAGNLLPIGAHSGDTVAWMEAGRPVGAGQARILHRRRSDGHYFNCGASFQAAWPTRARRLDHRDARLLPAPRGPGERDAGRHPVSPAPPNNGTADACVSLECRHAPMVGSDRAAGPALRGSACTAGHHECSRDCRHDWEHAGQALRLEPNTDGSGLCQPGLRRAGRPPREHLSAPVPGCRAHEEQPPAAWQPARLSCCSQSCSLRARG